MSWLWLRDTEYESRSGKDGRASDEAGGCRVRERRKKTVVARLWEVMLLVKRVG